MVTTATPRSALDGRDEHDEQEDWPSQVADAIERVVGTVRDRTTGPLLTIAKAIVYGTFAVLIGSVALVMAVVGLVRAVDMYLPDSLFGEFHMWAADLIVGLLFLLIGGILWSRRRASEQTSAD